MASFSKTFDFNFRRDHQKISHERRVDESVNEKSLSSLGYVPKNDEKNNSGDKGLNQPLLQYIHLKTELFISSIFFK